MSDDARQKYHWLPEATNDYFVIPDSAASDQPDALDEPDKSNQPGESADPAISTDAAIDIIDVIDPWSRPDVLADEDDTLTPDQSNELDAAVNAFLLAYDLPGSVTEPCPCCGAALPSPRWPGDICPQCRWEFDPFVAAPTEPSDLNHGLLLEEAQWNFRTFGVSDPAFLATPFD